MRSTEQGKPHHTHRRSASGLRSAKLSYWDRELPGFGVRVLSVRIEGLHGAQAIQRGKSRRVTIGSHEAVVPG